jgi:hypothetical protein
MRTKDSSRPFNSDVFEPGSECTRLLYNKPSSSLVAQFRRIDTNGLPREELYVRATNEIEYRKVAITDSQISCWDPLSCARRPFIVFNAVKVQGAGGDWVSISKVNLPSGDAKPLLDSSTLKVPSHYARAWIASILDIDPEGDTVVCRVALETERGEFTKVNYFVSEIDLGTGAISNLVALPDTFI